MEVHRIEDLRCLRPHRGGSQRTRSVCSLLPVGTSTSRAATEAFTSPMNGGKSWQPSANGRERHHGGRGHRRRSQGSEQHPRVRCGTTSVSPRSGTTRGQGSGVWRSTDGGRKFTEVEIPHELKPEEVGRIGVAFAPSDPNRAYAIVANKLDGTGVGLFRSDDGGTTFTKTAVGGGSLSQSSFGWWFGRLWVDPDTPDTLWIPGVNLLRSTDGGDSVASVSGPHADQHAMAWDPEVPNRVYLGNDGGMYTSANDGSTWTGGTSQGWTQHYTVDVGELTPGPRRHGTAGQRLHQELDRARERRRPVDHLRSLRRRTRDAHQPAARADPLRVLAVRSRAASRREASRPAFRCDFDVDRNGWWTPIIFDPADSSTMYFGGQQGEPLDERRAHLDRHQRRPLEERTSTGSPLRLQDQRRHHDDSGLGIGPRDRVGRHRRRAPVEDRGRSAPGRRPGRRSRARGLPDSWITRVAIDPADENIVYVTYSGYRDGEQRSTCAQDDRRWSDLDEHLPGTARRPGQRHRDSRGAADRSDGRRRLPLGRRGGNGSGSGRTCRPCR